MTATMMTATTSMMMTMTITMASTFVMMMAIILTEGTMARTPTMVFIFGNYSLEM